MTDGPTPGAEQADQDAGITRCPGGSITKYRSYSRLIVPASGPF
jgi:hypothetical protein